MYRLPCDGSLYGSSSLARKPCMAFFRRKGVNRYRHRYSVSKNSNSDDDEYIPKTTEVQIVHQLRYCVVVLPGRVVALPGYFSRLIPEIGARNAWLYVGWRKTVWDGQRQDCSPRTRCVPVRQSIHQRIEKT